ncbi:hypothetical protein OG819_42935 [Streptomyces sp. NBC_01549]|uniref:hypothetical protein n=1 Tax=Streptomyces sp. NBC_01549 TaxID=2975874 RepID=UPI00225A85D2|nr:hypothetical protein [Streptomyces sp. NBC_01549]MCX4596174.1 hypothetical protein [Streptomyces sp. NBC_01549]
MSITIPFVSRREKPRKANRVEVKLARTREQLAAVRQDNVKLLNRQAEADDFFALLMNDVVTTNEAWQQEKKARTLLEDINRSLRSEVDAWQELADDLRAQLAPFLAAEANANRVDVPPMVRPIDGPEDQATGPIYVKPLWEALGVHYAGPGAASPAHVPAWAVADEPAAT